MLEELKKEVYEANMLLPKYGLVTFTWGNVSGIDREKGLFVIKPSGVDYDKLTPDDMVVMDLEGNRVEGTLNPSSDTKTHLILYNRFPKIGGVVHTHSPWATSWAQAGRDIPCYGTTHADYIYGSVPCARNLNEEELKNYEWNTGVLIADLFEERKLDPMAVPCVLCKNHGPFTWGKDAHEAVHNAVVLEEVAKMAARCEMINPDVKEAPQCLQDKHYLRKHGPALDKLRLLENPKLMRNRRLRHIKQLCNVADTHLRLKQHKQNPDPRRITKYLKQLRQIIQIIVIRQHSPDRLHNLIVNSTLLTALYIMNCHPISPFMLRVSALLHCFFRESSLQDFIKISLKYFYLYESLFICSLYECNWEMSRNICRNLKGVNEMFSQL